MKQNYSDITVVLDRSGSMECLTNEVIGAFNTFVDEQKQVEGEATFTLIQFDDHYEVNCEAINIQDVSHLDETTYVPRGMTALFDAVGKAILSTGKRLSAMAEPDRPEKVIFLIQTDGEENSSTEMNNAAAKAALDRARAKGWEVVFLGTEFSNFDDATGVGQTASRNMAVSKEQLSDSMGRLAQKSKEFAAGAAPSVEWTAEDRAAAKEEEVKQRNNGSTSPSQRGNQ